MTKTKIETLIKYIKNTNKNIKDVKITAIDPVTFSKDITCIEAEYQLNNISIEHICHGIFYYTKGKRSIELITGNIYYK